MVRPWKTVHHQLGPRTPAADGYLRGQPLGPGMIVAGQLAVFLGPGTSMAGWQFLAIIQLCWGPWLAAVVYDAVSQLAVCLGTWASDLQGVPLATGLIQLGGALPKAHRALTSHARLGITTPIAEVVVLQMDCIVIAQQVL